SYLGGPARSRAVTRSRAYRGRGRPSLPSQSGPPSAAGRWSLLPLAEADPTVRALATAELLLERHGVVTRGSVVRESVVLSSPPARRWIACAASAGSRVQAGATPPSRLRRPTPRTRSARRCRGRRTSRPTPPRP